MNLREQRAHPRFKIGGMTGLAVDPAFLDGHSREDKRGVNQLKLRRRRDSKKGGGAGCSRYPADVNKFEDYRGERQNRIAHREPHGLPEKSPKATEKGGHESES